MRFFQTIISSCLSGIPFNYGPLGHLHIQKYVWSEVVKPGCIVVDATCGNGYDACYLADLLRLDDNAANDPRSKLYCIDIQEEAIINTQVKLKDKIGPENMHKVKLIHGDHAILPSDIHENSVSLIYYNLGYLPGLHRGSDTFVKTNTTSTMQSIASATHLLAEEGLLSVTAYPGHEGGIEEVVSVRDYLATLSAADWRVYEHSPVNRPKSPSVFFAYKIGKSALNMKNIAKQKAMQMK